MTIVSDRFRRPLSSLRISVTDRCNIRCRYCMPEDEYLWLPRESILTFEETERLVAIFSRCGVSKLRITGGEPLLRHDLVDLVALLAKKPGINDLALTTNGLLLANQAAPLREAGLNRVTISLDTLRPDRFLAFTKSKRHADVLIAIQAVRSAGFTGTKLNSVIINGFNDDELIDLIEFGRQYELEVRFIEYMDVGGATRWSQAQVLSRSEMLDRIGNHYGGVNPVVPRGPAERHAPADRFVLPDGTTIGIIASTTEPFCRSCDRSRLTADGMWFLCLYAVTGIDLKERMRRGLSDDELVDLISSGWRDRTDRGAEERLAVPDRTVLHQVEGLRADPHKEMHTRGG